MVIEIRSLIPQGKEMAMAGGGGVVWIALKGNKGTFWGSENEMIFAFIDMVILRLFIFVKIHQTRVFSGGPVVKNPPTNVGDTGLIPGPGRSHMPQGN